MQGMACSPTAGLPSCTCFLTHHKSAPTDAISLATKLWGRPQCTCARVLCDTGMS